MVTDESAKVIIILWFEHLYQHFLCMPIFSQDYSITALFHSLGEVPSVTALQPVEAVVSGLGFNSSCRCVYIHYVIQYIELHTARHA